MSTTLSSGGRYAADDGSAAVSGVSWGAVFAGGVTAAAISAILLVCGAGLGLASVSPWANGGVSASTFTVLAAIWLIIVQWVSAAFGGYMAGRLRTKWANVHNDEVFFRDTAHGFLAWALGTLIAVGLMTAASTSAAGTGVHAAAAAASGSTTNGYFVDMLYRQTPGIAATSNNAAAAMVTGMSDAQMRSQAATILAEGALNGGVPAGDEAYLTQMVSARTGLSPAEAQARVDNVLAQAQAAEVKAKQAVDAGRKAASGAAIFTFISMLIGAFIASVSGAIGGRLRDNY